MSLIVGPYFQGDPKVKPQQWGSFSDVQSALFHNAERMGIDPSKMVFRPMWSPGDQRDYGRGEHGTPSAGVSFEKNGLAFNGSAAVSIPTSSLLQELGSSFCHTFVVGNTGTAKAALTGTFNDGTSTGYQVLINTSSTETFQQGSVYAFFRGPTGNLVSRSGGLNSNAVGQNETSIITVRIQSGTDIEIFVNGKKYAVVYNNIQTFTGFSSFSYPLTLGARNVRGTFDNYYSGSMYADLICHDLTDIQINNLHDIFWQLLQPVPQKTIFLPLGEDTISPITVTGSCSFSGEVTRKVLYNRSVEGEI